MPPLNTQHSALSTFRSWWRKIWPAGQAAVPERLLAALPDMVLHIGGDGFLHHMHSPHGYLTMLDGERDIGKHISQLGLPESLAQNLWQRVRQAIQTGEVVQWEYEVQVGEISRRREIRCVALNPEEAVVVIRDVTEREQTLQILHQQSQAQNMLAQISSMLLDAPPAQFKETMAQALLAVGKLYNLDCAVVFEVQDEGETAAVTHIWSAEPERTHAMANNLLYLANIPNSLSHLQAVPPQAYHWLWPNEERLSQLPHLKHVPCTSALIVPIVYRKILVGMLFLGRWRPPLAWNPDTIQQMHFFTDIFVAGLARTRTEQTLRDYATELEDHVAQRTAELRQTNEELQRALRAKDEFLSTMSHELRTPLHAVIGLSQAMKEQIRGPLNERQLHTVGIIEQSGYRLLNLINNILDLAKLETGKLALRYQTFNLHHFGEGCVEAVRRQAAKKQIELRYVLNDHTAELTSDFQRLQQIIHHLLTNALKFTEVGGQVELEIRCETAVSQVIFVVRDTGIGIEAADLPRIFEPFVQLDSSLARQHEGTGLGLGLAAKMAHLLDGELTAASTPGKGSTFTLTLPWK